MPRLPRFPRYPPPGGPCWPTGARRGPTGGPDDRSRGMTLGGSKTMRAWVVRQPGPIETNPLSYVQRPVPAAALASCWSRYWPAAFAAPTCTSARVTCRYTVNTSPPVTWSSGARARHRGEGSTHALCRGWCDRVGVAWLRSHRRDLRLCRRGHENLCPNSLYTGWDADGGYAEYTTVPAAFAYRPPALSRMSSWPHCCAPGSSATGRCCGRPCRARPARAVRIR